MRFFTAAILTGLTALAGVSAPVPKDKAKEEVIAKAGRFERLGGKLVVEPMLHQPEVLTIRFRIPSEKDRNPYSMSFMRKNNGFWAVYTEAEDKVWAYFDGT